jgi:5-methylcytosine-specific restriction protein B
MARFNPHEKSAALYPVVSEFADRCLLQDGSILQPDLRLWTAENISELDRTFVQNPDEGTDSYYQKLEQQMSSGTPESRQLMAELHWVLFTCPSDMGPATKAESQRDLVLVGHPASRGCRCLERGGSGRHRPRGHGP